MGGVSAIQKVECMRRPKCWRGESRLLGKAFGNKCGEEADNNALFVESFLNTPKNGSTPVTQNWLVIQHMPTCSGCSTIRPSLEVIKDKTMSFRSCSSKTSYDASTASYLAEVDHEMALEGALGESTAPTLSVSLNNVWLSAVLLPPFSLFAGVEDMYDAVYRFWRWHLYLSSTVRIGFCIAQ